MVRPLISRRANAPDVGRRAAQAEREREQAKAAMPRTPSELTAAAPAPPSAQKRCMPMLHSPLRDIFVWCERLQALSYKQGPFQPLSESQIRGAQHFSKNSIRCTPGTLLSEDGLIDMIH
jgi:hypothetical protein